MWRASPTTVGFPADDERHAVLRDQAATTVQVIVGDDVERSRALFVERAFGALGTEPGSSYAVRSSSGTPALARESLRSADLVFWVSATGVDRRAVVALEQFVRDGGRVVVACGPALDPRVADVVTRPFGITLAGGDAPVSRREAWWRRIRGIRCSPDLARRARIWPGRPFRRRAT